MTIFYVVLGAIIASLCAAGWIYGLYHRGEAKGLRGDVKFLGAKCAREEEMHDDTLARAESLADELERTGQLIGKLGSSVDYWRLRYAEVQRTRLGDVSGDDLRDLVNRMQLDLPDEDEDRGEAGRGGEVEDQDGDGDEDSRLSEGEGRETDPDPV
jgi:hypothetical protein